MPQNQATGAKGDRYGREYGRRVASALGATNVSTTSNECEFKGERVAIHCARRKTKSVGVTLHTMERLQAVLGAFEQEDGSYRVYRLPIQTYRQYMEPTHSKGRSAGKVVLVNRSVFEERGTLVGDFHAI